MADEKVKHIVRIANTDLVGEKAVGIALLKIKGIGVMFSNFVLRNADVDPRKKTGLLDAREIERMNEVIMHPDKFNVPAWFVNRKQEIETGVTKHLITSDLDFAVEQDLRRMKKIKSYRGIRHATGQPVRGQRTKSNFRRNKGKAVGVKKKADAKSGGK